VADKTTNAEQCDGPHSNGDFIDVSVRFNAKNPKKGIVHTAWKNPKALHAFLSKYTKKLCMGPERVCGDKVTFDEAAT
jgi:hypothetical protein